MGWFDFLKGPPGNTVSITGASADSNGLMTLKLSDDTSYNVQLPSGKDGKPGRNVTGVSINAEGNLILAMSDGTTVNGGRIVGTQGPPGKDGAPGASIVNDPNAVAASLTGNNTFIDTLSAKIARDSANLSSNVVAAIKTDDTLRNNLATTLGSNAEFKSSLVSQLSSGANKLAFKGDPGAIADLASLKGTFGWETLPTITKANDNTKGILEDPKTATGSLKTLWCADGVKRYGDSITSTICTAPGPLNLHFTNKYAGVGENDITAAEISNDTTTDVYKKLMLVGNRSGADGKRTVGVYDNLDVEGNITTKGKKLTLGDASFNEAGAYVNLYKKDGVSGQGFAANTLHSWGPITTDSSVSVPNGTVSAKNITATSEVRGNNVITNGVNVYSADGNSNTFSIDSQGDVKGLLNLEIAGDIKAGKNITAVGNIKVVDVNAGNIAAANVNAVNIGASAQLAGGNLVLGGWRISQVGTNLVFKYGDCEYQMDAIDKLRKKL